MLHICIVNGRPPKVLMHYGHAYYVTSGALQALRFLVQRVPMQELNIQFIQYCTTLSLVYLHAEA